MLHDGQADLLLALAADKAALGKDRHRTRTWGGHGGQTRIEAPARLDIDPLLGKPQQLCGPLQIRRHRCRRTQAELAVVGGVPLGGVPVGDVGVVDLPLGLKQLPGEVLQEGVVAVAELDLGCFGEIRQTQVRLAAFHQGSLGIVQVQVVEGAVVVDKNPLELLAAVGTDGVVGQQCGDLAARRTRVVLVDEPFGTLELGVGGGPITGVVQDESLLQAI